MSFRDLVEQARIDTHGGYTNHQVLLALDGIKGDDLDVLGLIIERMQMGAKTYGAFDLENEQRDLGAETLYELVDGTVYLSGLIKQFQLKQRHLQDVRERIIAKLSAVQEMVDGDQSAVMGYGLIKSMVNAEFGFTANGKEPSR